MCRSEQRMATMVSRFIWRVWETPFSTENCWVSDPRYQRAISERERNREKRIRKEVK
jgi:hypothetical protein